jgi:hypothetical protein
VRLRSRPLPTGSGVALESLEPCRKELTRFRLHQWCARHYHLRAQDLSQHRVIPTEDALAHARCSSNTASTSAGLTLLPPTLIQSRSRPTIRKRSGDSFTISTTSPVSTSHLLP